MRRLLWLPLFLVACEAAPGTQTAPFPPARDAMRVEILDDSFVRVDGKRMARYEFLYRARRDGRRWAKRNLAAPKVILRAEGPASPAARDELIAQLRLAGVSRIEVVAN